MSLGLWHVNFTNAFHSILNPLGKTEWGELAGLGISFSPGHFDSSKAPASLVKWFVLRADLVRKKHTVLADFKLVYFSLPLPES